ncbi:hypothetical protein LTR17_023528 [Elasticomyces elasticus]|nr:hypothetical protein LTR17_023528 [Elasticomyces elasticus]
MYSARLMLGWLPTGSGDATRSAYGPFLDGLTEGAQAHRRARAINYEIQRTQREHHDVAGELDEARIELLRYQRQRTVPPDLHARLEEFNEGFRARTVKLEQLMPRLKAAKEEARTIAVQVYALEPSVTNAVFRPDPPDVPLGLHTSPKLFGMLRSSKEAHWVRSCCLPILFFTKTCHNLLLEDDRKQEQQAKSGVCHSAARLKEAAARVQHLIDLAEQGEHMTEFGMESMASLQRRMDGHRTAIEGWKVLKAKTERRDLEQWLYEEEMFLDLVAPVLEADGRIEVDRLRSANIDRNQSGERYVFQRGPDSSSLTQDQKDRYLGSFRYWWNQRDDRRAVVASLNEEWGQELRSLGNGHSSTAVTRWSGNLNEDLQIAEERVKEAERFLQLRSYEIVDRCGEEPLFNFPDHPDDREDSEPPMEQRLLLGGLDMDAVERWKVLVQESHLPDSAITQGSLHPWPWRPVGLGEPGAYDGYWLPEDEKWLRDNLIKISKKAAEHTRLGLAIAASSRITRLLERLGLR